MSSSTTSPAWPASVAIAFVSTVAVVSTVYTLRKKNSKKTTNETNNLKYVRLTEQEEAFLGLGLAPISTATWFSGDSNEAAKFLQDRVGQILNRNPWLAGEFTKKQGHYHIVYDADNKRDATSTSKKVDSIFQVGHVDGDSISPAVPFDDLAKRCSPFLLEFKNDLHQPFWKVVVVPCAGSSKFLLVVSMSHVVGDGHTFYSLHHMLTGAKEVGSLEVERNPSTKEQQEKALGKSEATVSYSAGVIFCALRGVFLSKVVVPLFGRKDLQVTNRFLLVDEKKIAAIKAALIQEGDDTVPFVSTNDIITSWFLSDCQSDLLLLALNFRGKLEDHTDDMAGNYENVLYYRKEDVASPVLIRKSVQDLKRAVTKDRDLSSLEMARQQYAICTNWASFFDSSTVMSLPDCQFLTHLPLIDTKSVLPCTMTICVIFHARPQQLGVWISGTPEKLKNLVATAPFVANEPFVSLSKE